MKKRMIFIICLFVILLSIFMFFVTKNFGKKYLEDTNKINYSYSDILIKQEKINNDISGFAKDKIYTLDSPKIILNPYGISPLTALIIFSTDEELELYVSINGEYNFTTEKTRNHIIPIYGLYQDFNNEVIIDIGGKNKTYFVQTDKVNDVNPLEVSKKNISDINNLYFMTSPVGTSASAYDGNGNLKWYLTERFTMDFEWLENGHFLVGIKEASVADRKIGFVEMDYLGKIYNYYILKNGYEFEFQLLKNGNYMLCGGDKPVFYNHALIYEIDSKTGEVVSQLDLYNVFKKIDPDFDEGKLNFKIIRNAFYYNENNGEILVSLRGLNAIVSIDYNTEEINYIFAPDGIFNDKFDEYMVKPISGRYPLGSHSVFLTDEGYVGFINNGYDRYNGFEVGGIDKVSYYKDDYISAEIYEIKNKKAKLVWSFDDGKKYFSHQYGSFSINEGDKLINFGWTLENDYRKNSKATLSESEKTTDYTFAKIYEIDRDDNVIFKAKIDDGKYRVFKHNLYDIKMDSFDYANANFYNTMEKSDLEKISTKSLTSSLDNAEVFENNIVFTKYSLDVDYNFDEYDGVDILLVGKRNSYKVNYKDEQKNVVKNLNIDLKKGEYALYLIINNIYYDTNIKVIYDK